MESYGTNTVKVGANTIFSITLNPNGGEHVDTIYFDENTRREVVLPLPVHYGFKFNKWKDEQTGIEYGPGSWIPSEFKNYSFKAQWIESLWGENTQLEGGYSSHENAGKQFTADKTYTGYLLNENKEVVSIITSTIGRPTTTTKKVTVQISKTFERDNTYPTEEHFCDREVVVTGDILRDLELKSTSSSSTNKAIVTISDNGITGTLDGREVFASVDRFAANVTEVAAKVLSQLLLGKYISIVIWKKDKSKCFYCMTVHTSARAVTDVSGHSFTGRDVIRSGKFVYGEGSCITTVVITDSTDSYGGIGFNVYNSYDIENGNVNYNFKLINVSDIYDSDCLKVCDKEDFEYSAVMVDVNSYSMDHYISVNFGGFTIPEGETLVEPQTNTVRLTFKKETVGNLYTFDAPASSTISINEDTGETVWNGQNDFMISDLRIIYGKCSGTMKVCTKKFDGTKWTLKKTTVDVFAAHCGNMFRGMVCGTAPTNAMGCTYCEITKIETNN